MRIYNSKQDVFSVPVNSEFDVMGYTTKNENGLFEINYELKRTLLDWVLRRKANCVVIELVNSEYYSQTVGRPYKAKHFNKIVRWAVLEASNNKRR